LIQPEILYVSDCVPYPPNKGEKIRAYHQLRALAEHFRIHLFCLGRDDQDAKAAQELSSICASIQVDVSRKSVALAKASIRFACGDCLNTAFYASAPIRRKIAELDATRPIAAAVAYSVVMFPFVPSKVPTVLDMIDVDSEKWFQYAKERPLGFLYGIEARRLRRTEVCFAKRAALSLFSTAAEEQLFLSFSPPTVRTAVLGNGVDFEFFDPTKADLGTPTSRRTLLFTGSMDYHPNIDAALWFASGVLPELRRADPGIEFHIVGRNPSSAVNRLSSVPGVKVIGAVPDVRPYLKTATAVVAPLLCSETLLAASG
jgi:sugar transferase (PEP-CTERM/EpsH1 system associated)